MNHFVTIVLICMVFPVLCARKIAETPHADFGSTNGYYSYYQDLTELINEVLQSNDSELYNNLLDAVNHSPYIFYKTDIQLKSFEDIMPIISLLEAFSSANKHPQLILSLECVNHTTGYFLHSRLSDVYQSFQNNISAASISRIANFLTAFVMDFRASLSSSDLRSFYNEMGSNTKYIALVNSTKEFIQLTFGYSAFPVGVIYKYISYLHNLDSRTFLFKELKDADFLIRSFSLNMPREFPKFPNKIGASFKPYLQEDKRILEKSANISVMVEIINATWDPVYHYSTSENYWNLFGRVLAATPNYTRVSSEMKQEAWAKGESMIIPLLTEWANREQFPVVVFSGKLLTHTNFNNLEKAEKSQIVPFLNFDTTKNLTHALEKLQENLVQTQREIMMDELTWRKLALSEKRHPISFTTCEKLSVTLRFTKGIASVWQQIQDDMNDLVYKKSELANLKITLLLFHEDDIKASSQIQEFLKKAQQQKLKIGCALEYYVLMYRYSAAYNGILSNLFNTVIEEHLCQPMFSMFDTFTWIVDSRGEFKDNGIFGAYSDMLLGRKIFMEHFQKNVTVEFSFAESKQILSEIFDVPIVMPYNQIL